MAKTIIKFSAVPYQIGTGEQAKTGYRPQLEAQPGLFDLPFCREVVNEKRLQTSPDELLHEMEMVAEVATAKVAEDGRPRGITKLLKWNRFAKGNLESPTSPWNDSCKAEIRPQLLADASKIVDASFQNVNEGIGVRLNYVAWLGAQSVINVIKVGKSFAAYGNHMEWLTGDTATLTVGTTSYPLTCTESDVAHAVFSWPAGLNPEAGTQAEFFMKSRGGIEDGQVYTSKKTVTVIAGDPTPVTKITNVHGPSRNTDTIAPGDTILVEGENFGPLKTGDCAAQFEYTAEFETKSCTVPSSLITDFSATHVSIGSLLGGDAKPGGTVHLTLFFADNTTKERTATILAV